MRRVAEIVMAQMNLGTQVIYSDTPTTWAGDVEKSKDDVTKLRSLGWAAKWNT